MNLEKPEIMLTEKAPLSLYYEHSYSYSDNSLPGMTHYIKVGIYSLGTGEKDKEGGINVGYYSGPQDIPENILQKFVAFKKLVNNCVNYGEEINQMFLGMASFQKHHNHSEIVRLNSLDFMKLKDSLMEEVKKNDKLRHLTNKAFRRSLDNFITYRNIFTHGVLCLISSGDGIIEENKFGIQYFDKHTKQTVVISVSMELINVYVGFYQCIINFAKEYKAAKIA